MEGIAKEWAFASRKAYNRDITAMESILNQIDNPFTRTENCKFRQEMTGNLTTMESLNFHLHEIAQLALVWIN